MSNYNNFDLRNFINEGKKEKAHKTNMDEQDVALDETDIVVASEGDLTEGTDIIDMVMQNPQLLGYLATYGAGLFAAVKGGLSAMDYV